jgi:hypothetical protein
VGALTFLIAALILLGPPLSIIGLLVWVGRVRKTGTRRFVVWVAYVLAAIAGLAIVSGYVGTVIAAIQTVGGDAVDPSQKARVLAEGISEGMNCGAFGFLVALVAVGWLSFWRWRGRRKGPGG